MLQNYTYKFRLYPNKSDKELLSKQFGCCRFVYNYFLAENKIEYEATKQHNTYYKNCELLKELKKKENRVILPKFRNGIKFDNHREIEGKILKSTISQIPSGEYYVTITTEREISQLNQIDKDVGIDLGIKDFCVTSDGIKISNPKFKKSKISNLKFWTHYA